MILNLIFTAFLGLLFTTTTIAQTRQPFKNIGKETTVVTLSNGRYDEFFDEDSLQRLGSAIININTKKITKIKLSQEEIDELENARASRFLSVDPIASSYPMLTPYQYASNRPIDGTDMDGLEWATETTIGKTSSAIAIQTSFTVRVKVENKSNLIKDPNIIKAKAEVYKNALESEYKGETTVLLFGIPFKVIYKTEVVLDYTDRKDCDGAIGHLVFDDRTSSSKSVKTVSGDVITTTTETISTPGITIGAINGFTSTIGITMDGKIVSDAEITSTDEHEGGHSAGLKHPWKLSEIEKRMIPSLDQSNTKTAVVTTIKNNIMNSAENPDITYSSNGGPELLWGQLEVIRENISTSAYYKPSELKTNNGPNCPTSTDESKSPH